MIHALKTWQPFFDDVVSEKKRFEIRKNDRGFQVGDILILQEWNQSRKFYTGNEHLVSVIYKIDGGHWGIHDDYCVLGISNYIVVTDDDIKTIEKMRRKQP